MNNVNEKIKKYSDIKKLIKNSLDIIGIFDGEYAYKGPDCVQIDLTNNCNNNCIACWCNSPLLRDKAISPEAKKQTLDYNIVVKLINQLYALRTAELYFSGGGEPLMHPRAMDILTYAKSKGFTCTLHTNFTLVDENTLNRLKEIKLDHLVISLWAATPETYAKTHPNKKPDDFLRMKRMLRFLNETKDCFPKVRIYNVVSRLNYREFIPMVELSTETLSECVEFTVVDTIPERTDELLLDSGQCDELLQACNYAKMNTQYYAKDGRFKISNFDQFVRRISSEHGGQAEYDRGFLDMIPCYVGWLFARIIADGNVNSCLKSHRIPIGNLYKEDFKDIWNGRMQRQFRRCMLNHKNEPGISSMIGNDPDKDIGCYKSCDDLGRNMFMHEKISALTKTQKILLHAAMNIKRLQRTTFGNVQNNLF
ncbi:MAG: radical SAM protein [Deltaproteobacteria bacterium]